MVDVAHDGHDWGARQLQGGIVLLEELLLGRGGDRGRLAVGAVGDAGAGDNHVGNLVSEFLGYERRGLTVYRLVDVGEDAALDQLTDDVRRVDAQCVRQVFDRDAGRQLQCATISGIARRAADLKEGVRQGGEAIDSGQAAATLTKLRNFGEKYAAKQ